MDLKKLFIADMANFDKDDTGLPVTVWIEHKRNTKHKLPRIKVLLNNNLVPVSIEDNPRILVDISVKSKLWSKIEEFIISNKELLLTYWNDVNYSTGNLLRNLKKV